jgi:beta-lactamase class C
VTASRALALIAACCVAVLAAPARADSLPQRDQLPPRLISAYPYLEDALDRFDQAAESPGVVGLAVAIIEDGEPVLMYVAGETAAGSGEPVTENTAFRAASLTKSFTGGLAALLESEGLINLDAPVPEHILNLKRGPQPTWLQILSHQTGLPPNAYDNIIEGERLSGQRVRERLAEVDQLCDVGECYTYQNVAFSAFEVLVEEATGLNYEQAVEQYLFNPLGLESASVGAQALTTMPSWARPHRGWRRRADRPGRPDSPYDKLPSAAGINLTLNDLVVWAQANLAKEGGLPETVRERAFTPYIDTPGETRRLGGVRSRVSQTHYGLGWRIYEWGDRTLVMHSGYLSGYGAQVVLEPETGFGFVALWNADTRAPWRLWPTVMDLRTGDGPGDWLDRLERG